MTDGKAMPPLVADRMNDDGVVKLCETLLKQYHREYSEALSSGSKRSIERYRNELEQPFMRAITDTLNISKENIIITIEEDYGNNEQPRHSRRISK